MTQLPGTPSDEVSEVLATGRGGITTLFVSMATRHPEGTDADYLRWHTLDVLNFELLFPFVLWGVVRGLKDHSQRLLIAAILGHREVEGPPNTEQRAVDPGNESVYSGGMFPQPLIVRPVQAFSLRTDRLRVLAIVHLPGDPAPGGARRQAQQQGQADEAAKQYRHVRVSRGVAAGLGRNANGRRLR